MKEESGFKDINPADLTDNAIRIIGTDWMLISAGDEKRNNMMTASWGGLGVLWNKPVSFIFIRPTRHTYGLVETNDTFSLCFLAEGYRKVLNLCGSTSGRDMDKVKASCLTPVFRDGTMFFEESRLVLVCKKVYLDDLKPENFFVQKTDKEFYKARDYHRLYIGEITKAYKK